MCCPLHHSPPFPPCSLSLYPLADFHPSLQLAKAEPPKVEIAAPLPPRNPNEELRDIYNFKPKPSGAMHYGLIDNWH